MISDYGIVMDSIMSFLFLMCRRRRIFSPQLNRHICYYTCILLCICMVVGLFLCFEGKFGFILIYLHSYLAFKFLDRIKRRDRFRQWGYAEQKQCEYFVSFALV